MSNQEYKYTGYIHNSPKVLLEYFRISEIVDPPESPSPAMNPPSSPRSFQQTLDNLFNSILPDDDEAEYAGELFYYHTHYSPSCPFFYVVRPCLLELC